MKRITGRIIKGTGGLYTVLTDEGTVSCRARGVFRHEKDSPYVGDTVTVELDEHSNSVIYSIDNRKSLLIRPPLANLDLLFCVIPSRNPPPDLFTLDKLISIIEAEGIEPVIVVTKTDIDSGDADRIAAIYSHAGFEVFRTAMSEKGGIDCLRTFIAEKCRDKISAYAGVSGAGKSTLVNLLFPALGLKTGRLSEKSGRGSHTTRTVELFNLSELLGIHCDGFIADTPGFSMLDFSRFDFFDKLLLPDTFREFEEYIGKCKYTKCTHLCEEGCAIVDAVRRGDIEKTRHESYVALYNILKTKNKWDKKR